MHFREITFGWVYQCFKMIEMENVHKTICLYHSLFCQYSCFQIHVVLLDSLIGILPVYIVFFHRLISHKDVKCVE